jgi:hypothetical protein
VQRKCALGCRGDGECQAPNTCLDHRCGHDCKTPCPPDGDPCTSDACVNNSCPYAPAPDGTACAPSGQDCTDAICHAGACTHPPTKDGAPCTSDGIACHAALCQSGACTHPTQADDTPCAAFMFCRGGTCQEPSASCRQDAAGSYSVKWKFRTNLVTATSCACQDSTGTIKRVLAVTQTTGPTAYTCDQLQLCDTLPGAQYPNVCW